MVVDPVAGECTSSSSSDSASRNRKSMPSRTSSPLMRTIRLPISSSSASAIEPGAISAILTIRSVRDAGATAGPPPIHLMATMKDKGRLGPLQAMSPPFPTSGKRCAAHRAARGPGLGRLAAVRAGEPELAPQVHVILHDPPRRLVRVRRDEHAHGAQVPQVDGEREVVLLRKDLEIGRAHV